MHAHTHSYTSKRILFIAHKQLTVYVKQLTVYVKLGVFAAVRYGLGSVRLPGRKVPMHIGKTVLTLIIACSSHCFPLCLCSN